MSPQMMEMMKGMDFNQDKVNKQFAELGLKPEDVISKARAPAWLCACRVSPLAPFAGFWDEVVASHYPRRVRGHQGRYVHSNAVTSTGGLYSWAYHRLLNVLVLRRASGPR